MTGPLAAPAQAAVSSVALVGHGWGHGRGMSQYGAEGYARNHGWTANQIVTHFYGNTTAGDVGASDITVVLSPPGATATTGYSGATVVAAADAANRPLVQDGTGTPVPIPAGTTAVRVVRTSATTTSVQYAAGCAGTWSTAVTFSGTVTVHPANATDAAMLRLCVGAMTGSGTSSRLYRGRIVARSTASRQYTLNVVNVDAYLRGVLPSEVIASAWHMETLKAQAVAARSFALADAKFRAGSYGFEATCDTTSCQVYGGRAVEHARTDQAIAETAGAVRLRNGVPVRAEFHSSSGGWTAGTELGSLFPAVEDLGDSISSNPHHTWTITLSATTVANAYGRSAANFLGLTITGNGLGEGGGRATQVVVRFSDGNLTRTGNQFRATFGLKSDWFAVQGGSDQATRNYVDRLFRDFLGRAPSAGELDSWSAELYSGRISRLGLTQVLATSDEWAGAVVTRLYWDTLGRGPDGPGLAGWIQALRDGARVPDIAAGFYASGEFYGRSGSTPEGFVRELYRLILERQPDQAGLNAWTAASTTLAGRLSTAKGFFGSIESRRKRVTALYWALLGRAPDQAGLNGWADVLQTRDDIVLAATLATSNEYFSRAQTLAG